VQSALTSLSAVARSEQFAEAYMRAKRNAFREGMATQSDVVDAVLNLSRARLERVEMAYQFDVALARLLEASGMADAYPRYLHSKTAQSVY
jgi:outer membrane protein TolC